MIVGLTCRALFRDMSEDVFAESSKITPN